MTQKKRWRKAMITSLVIHSVVLTGLGWFSFRFPPLSAANEQVVELDLSQEEEPVLPEDMVNPSTEGQAKGGATQEQPQQVHPTPTATPHVAAVTSSMSVLSAKIPEHPVAATPISKAAAGPSAAKVSGSKGGSDNGKGSETSGTGNNGGAGTGSGSGSGSGSGHGSGSGISGYTHPGILSQVTPDYPDSARQQGIEGTVILKIQILPNGLPGSVSIYRSSGHESLDHAALAAVEQWRFIPARDRSSGEAITCVTTMPVVFHLN